MTGMARSGPAAAGFVSRATFDEYDRADCEQAVPPHNEHGALGWGESYRLQAYLLMYQAYQDTHYLDRLIGRIDQVLERRDHLRGVKEYRGLSLPAWRSAGHYTCGAVVLNDADGRRGGRPHRPVLEVRTASRPAHRHSIEVVRGTAPGTFKLIAVRTPAPRAGMEQPPVIDAYDNLSMDPTSPDYAVTRVNGAFAKVNGTEEGFRTMITLRDLRASPDAPSNPAPGGPFTFAAIPYIYAVQTGQITYPIATFIRLVHQTPELRSNQRYRARAETYLEAVERAVAVHEGEWREDPQTGEGWLAWPKGAPVVFDGAEQPHNQSLSLARTFVHLAAVASDPASRDAWRDRAAKMARAFKNDLSLDEQEAYLWTYFPSRGWGYRGWSAEDEISEYQPAFVYPSVGGYSVMEDTSHGHIDVGLAALVFQDDLGVFDRRDMRRFAATFTRNVLDVTPEGVPTTRHYVDGSGGKGAHDNMAASWMPLAKFDRTIFTAMRENYSRRAPSTQAPAVALGLAHLNRFAQRD